ncbi:MAG: heavy metal translocating P-type ATPase metal-binding domain-containing protein [Opitutaceae bacterium]|nr:heavy metal translocating P-type ATPase metal-binding domain-containing protein [Cytophagales bacterium]
MILNKAAILVKCDHCGEDCLENPLKSENKSFCCDGCKMVYELLQENDLCTYYDLEKSPGFKIKTKQKEHFAYLENEEIAEKLLNFNEGNLASITFYIPKIHCSSCIWLLENLYKIQPGIISSRINFLRKETDISFRKDKISLRKIAEILDSLGYTPEISLDSHNKKKSGKADLSLFYKLGITGFCASNIMMLSFPEYLGMDAFQEPEFKRLFSYLNLVLSLPVVFYGASGYFLSALSGIKNKVLNLDIPIALGTSAVFLRSVFEVISQTGSGYFDSLSGLIFFLLIGKWIQTKVYKQFSFERDYQSYFPISVTVLTDKEQAIPIKNLKINDLILVRNQEIIPADSLLIEGEARIDYSFVTGESAPVTKRDGELIYAGGRQTGCAIKLKVQKEVCNSYLLQLWNKQIFTKENDAYLSSFVLLFSRYFVWGTLAIAMATFVFWSFIDPSKVIFAVTSVLLVACPCALALSLPFALGNCLRYLGRNGLFLKNADTIEKLSQIDTIVFDKTGTLTVAGSSKISYQGEKLSEVELQLVKSVVAHSTHPLSIDLYKHIQQEILPTTRFSEIPGKGIIASIGKYQILSGSLELLGLAGNKSINPSCVHIQINGEYKGYFEIKNCYKENIENTLNDLGKNFELHLLSGDNNKEQTHLKNYFQSSRMLFSQSPTSKLAYIEKLKSEGKNVLMLGDGLNDAGALKAAHVGLSVSDDVYSFSPACDGILEGKQLINIKSFLNYSKTGIQTIKLSLALSLIYNAVGLFFAVKGELSPVIAAVLMPLSSVSIVLFVVALTGYFGARLNR